LADLVPPPRPAVRLAVSGDVLVHLPVAASAAAFGAAGGLDYDFRPMFRRVAPILRGAALALCHLEVPLSRDGDDLSGYPSFNAPPQLAAGLADAGYDGCSTASNHALDRREEGIDATLDALAAAGLGATGTARIPAEAGPRLYPAGPLTVGHLSFTYGTNGIPLPAPWMVNLIDREAILAQARWARRLGADFVVVSLHWGVEYRAAVTEAQASLAAELLASPDVDLLVGHHAHVVQPVGMVGDEYVVYGLGNSLSNQFFRDDTQDGVVVLPELVPRGGRWVVRSIAFAPTWVDPDGHRIVVVADALAGDGLTAGRRAELEASLRRTTSVLTGLGVPGLVALSAAASPAVAAITGLE
jgi:poly-gamma-glutamate synthesis protein (capsule biosynthesis protein)